MVVSQYCTMLSFSTASLTSLTQRYIPRARDQERRRRNPIDHHWDGFTCFRRVSATQRYLVRRSYLFSVHPRKTSYSRRSIRKERRSPCLNQRLGSKRP